MKVVQLTPYAMDRPGGVQSHVRDLSAWLRRQGHEVKIIAPPGAPAHAEEGLMPVGSARPISVHGTQFEISHANRAECRAAVSALHDWGADVVHLHTPWTPLLPWQIWRALKLPTIATFHATLPDGDGFDPLAWALRRVGHHFNRHISHLIVPSQAPYDQWAAAAAAPLPTILPPAIDLSQWRTAKDAAIAADTPDRFRVVYMGRLEARKGVAVLLKAWSQLQAALPDAELIIAGSGEEEATLREYARAAALTNVTFQPPPNNAQARNLMATADVFAAPALHGESFGLVLIEAMAAQAVPVAANNAGFATVMTGKGAELLCPPGDTNALADTIMKLAQNPAHLTACRSWATQHAARFDVTSVGPAYEALLQDACSGAS
ncbi:glycosyltransferase family 4 protein [Shimia sp.]|uniref:glycosyltransferase family 4 protein n=1 Tax=Shimia sp. TaxID=1954381 RepID=UPI003B8CE8DE